jgi:alkanesulfonate monooxygenase SsuD/methylene tetrahydromethanopterin reductase-like flavin-dependent oxidoreductase (luciferase family)
LYGLRSCNAHSLTRASKLARLWPACEGSVATPHLFLPDNLEGERPTGECVIRAWIFEFLYAPGGPGEDVAPAVATAVFDAGVAHWRDIEGLGFEGIFFSEHHFGVSYSPSPNLLIAAIARSTTRLRLGTMGMVLPLYQPWRVLEEIGMLDHLTGGRLEIGCASGVPPELIQVGMAAQESRERFNEALDILDAWLAQPVISHHGRYWSFDNLRIVPRPLQQPAPPKWTTVVSPASATKSARRGSRICTAFESAVRIREIFDAYRGEADRVGLKCGPEQLAIRRNISVARSEGQARKASRMAMDVTSKLLAADPRVGRHTSSLLDAPKAGSGFSVHADEFIAGTPAQVAEQIVEQCRACGAGHIVAILGRAVDRRRTHAVKLFGEEVIPILRRSGIA